MTKDWVHWIGYSPVIHVLLQIVMIAVITASLPAWTSSAGMLSTTADFLCFSSLHFFLKDGVVVPCISLETVQY